MMKKMLLAGLLIGAVTGYAHAADLKIAYVDVKNAIENTKTYQAGIQRLQALREKKQRELKALREKIQKAETELMNQSMAMSPERLAEKQEELNRLRKSYERSQQDAQEELLREKNRLDQGVLASFYEVVQRYGKEKGYSLILQKQPAVIYGATSFDITAEITKLLDQKQ